jgi:hypothetical protein
VKLQRAGVLGWEENAGVWEELLMATFLVDTQFFIAVFCAGNLGTTHDSHALLDPTILFCSFDALGVLHVIETIL